MLQSYCAKLLIINHPISPLVFKKKKKTKLAIRIVQCQYWMRSLIIYFLELKIQYNRICATLQVCMGSVLCREVRSL